MAGLGRTISKELIERLNRFDELQKQFFVVNAKLAQIKNSAKWLAKHVEFDMESNGAIYNEAAYEKLMFEIKESPAQSLVNIQADAVIDYENSLSSFPLSAEDYAQQLRDNANKSEGE